MLPCVQTVGYSELLNEPHLLILGSTAKDGDFTPPGRREGTVHTGKLEIYERKVAEYLDACGLQPNRILIPELVHGSVVWNLSPEEKGFLWSADGVTTAERNVALVIRGADCAPVAIYTDDAVAWLHVGRQGALEGIVPNAVRALQDEFCAHPSKMRAFIGPHICRECHEVGLEDAKKFRRQFSDQIVVTEKKRFFLDLDGVIRMQLGLCEIPPQEVVSIGGCTYGGTDHCRNGELWHSFRRETHLLRRKPERVTSQLFVAMLR